MSEESQVKNGVFSGRYTATLDGDFVLFLIGARIPLRHLPKAGWVGKAFGDMMKVLYQHPEKGFLGGESFTRLFPIMTFNMMYWRSYEHLEQFSRDKSDPHLEAWRRFNKEIGEDGTIGIWHETYLIKAGNYEVVYGNMPHFGMGKAGIHTPITGNFSKYPAKFPTLHIST
ncbi:MAG: DUF4188 domain-containing protein [Anaerolineae bacterium]|nr:DUF4188 domain-containing protein [Anaerolineae bacterium]